MIFDLPLQPKLDYSSDFYSNCGWISFPQWLSSGIFLTSILLYFLMSLCLGGLEALKKLQSLWIDHNQLTSTRGLTEVFTLQHLDLSHNHVARGEGLDNCGLLRTLRLAGNTLTEVGLLPNVPLYKQHDWNITRSPNPVTPTLRHSEKVFCVLARFDW